MGKGRDRSQAPWTFYSGRGIATLDTTIAGKRYRPSLGIPYDPDTASARDVRAIEAAAAKKYAELVAGRVVEVGPQARIMTSHTLHELLAVWLVEAEKLWPKSYKTRISQIGAVEAWAEEAPRFASDTRTPIERLVDDGGPAQFVADRLGQVLRKSVSGEVSNLYAFFDWAVRERYLRSEPPRPKLPRGAQGKRSGPQRSQPVDITEAEALAICAALPEWTAKGGGKVRGMHNARAIRVRDVFRLCWELALRPGIAQKISVPQHYVRGQSYVWISRDIDKIGLERRIPLTKAAKEILERCAPDAGVIFGVHELTHQIKRAAKAVLPPEKAESFARYDLRHGRAVHSLEVGNDLLGTSRLLGHTQLTTTNRYVRTREAHTARVIAALDAASAGRDGVSNLPASQNVACSEETKTMASLGKTGANRKTPAGKIPAGAKLASPAKMQVCANLGDSRCEAGRSALKDANDLPTDVHALSASRQHDNVPIVLTNLQRSISFTRSLLAMHDPYYDVLTALEDEEADS